MSVYEFAELGGQVGSLNPRPPASPTGIPWRSHGSTWLGNSIIPHATLAACGHRTGAWYRVSSRPSGRAAWLLEALVEYVLRVCKRVNRPDRPKRLGRISRGLQLKIRRPGLSEAVPNHATNNTNYSSTAIWVCKAYPRHQNIPSGTPPTSRGVPVSTITPSGTEARSNARSRWTKPVAAVCLTVL